MNAPDGAPTAAVRPEVAAFAAAVGPDGPVVAVGGRTQWDAGGPPDPAAREVRAPAGVWQHTPAELVVRCGAGTTVAELDAALAPHGQMVPLDPRDAERATVGGVLAVGRSGPRRLRYGPVRDSVLGLRYVSAEGRLVWAGGATVKNVSGYDLCRLLVGSLGTLGLLAEVVLRAWPLPPASRWVAGAADPFALYRRLYEPAAVLWDGATTWVLLEGYPDDVDAQAEATGLDPTQGPPPLPAGGRLSVPPAHLPGAVADLRGPWVAEVGVGVVHTATPVTRAVPPTPALVRRVKAALDPAGRLGPGRDPGGLVG